jgi:hypothetical protein
MYWSTTPKSKGTSAFHWLTVPDESSFALAKGGSMPAAQPSKELRALCHEHHIEMRLNRSHVNRNGDATQTPAYACTEPDCLVHYNILRGYFVETKNRNTSENEIVPRVRCPHDGAPMYLAEINPAKRGFRLWTCPQCDARRTNEDGLVSLPSHEIQGVGGKNAA